MTCGWQPQLMHNFVMKSQTTSFCVTESNSSIMLEPVKSMVREIQAWTKADKATIVKNPYAEKGIYPLAYIDGNLYFTCSKEHAQLNNQWGNDTMFFVKTDNLTDLAIPLDLSYKTSTKLIKLSGDEDKQIYTSQLGDIIQKKSGGLIDEFISYAKQSGGKLKVTYQDEHLKSVMGMIITLQTIEHIIKQIGNDFAIEYKVEWYKCDNGNADSISANQPSSAQRDSWLNSLTNAWIEDLTDDCNINGELIPVKSLDKRTLTHWRELSIECCGKKLSIYPDGGFINEWNIARQPNGVRFDTATITHDTKIYLYRIKEIKIDVCVE